MEEFKEILKELIDETNLSLRQLGKLSSVSAVQYSRYLNGAVPTIDVVLKIAKYFNCTLDYLFGLTDKRQGKFKSYNYNISKFVDNYKKLLSANKTTNYKFMKSANFDESILRHWQSGSKPRLDVVYYIAKNLGGSMDELIGRD